MCLQSMHVCWRNREACYDAFVEQLDLGGSRGAYAVLGLPDGAPMKDVRSAFRDKAKHVHPDKCAKPECAKKFRVCRKDLTLSYVAGIFPLAHPGLLLQLAASRFLSQ